MRLFLTYHGLCANELLVEARVFVYNDVLDVLKFTGIECATLTDLGWADKSKLRGRSGGEQGGGGLLGGPYMG